MVSQRGTDRSINVVLGSLLSVVFALSPLVLSSVGLPRSKTEPTVRCAPPHGWVETPGRWVCTDITPAIIDELLRTLKHSSSLPEKIRIVPPFAEVVWP